MSRIITTVNVIFSIAYSAMLFFIALVGSIDIFTRIILTIIGAIVAHYTVKKLRADKRLAEVLAKRAQMELDIKEEIFKNKVLQNEKLAKKNEHNDR